jgi:hypothetical protein
MDLRLWSGGDQNSHFEEGLLDLEPGRNGDVLISRPNPAVSAA